MRSPPLVVLEGRSPLARKQAVLRAAEAGWRVVEGWREAGPGVVCTGLVDSEETAQRAVLAAVAGAGLVVEAIADREVRDRLCDDLRRLGSVDHRVGEPEGGVALGDEERALLAVLLRGASLGEAARTLNLSRRTADRRLASARRALGVSTTAEAIVLARRMGLRSP